MNTSGAVLLGVRPSSPTLIVRQDSPRTHQQAQLSNLIRVGGKLAALGVEDGRRAMGWWHVVRPGSHAAPAGNSWGPDQEGRNLVYGSALCTDPQTGRARVVVTNGYAADWRPPVGQLCPACAEQL